MVHTYHLDNKLLNPHRFDPILPRFDPLQPMQSKTTTNAEGKSKIGHSKIIPLQNSKPPIGLQETTVSIEGSQDGSTEGLFNREGNA